MALRWTLWLVLMTAVALGACDWFAPGDDDAEPSASYDDNDDNNDDNDDASPGDDDLIPATVHVPEFLELAYWIVRTGYKGWLTLDIFPYREEKISAASESFAWIRTLLEAVQERGVDAITDIVRRGEGTDSVRLVREMLRGKR